MPRKHYVSALPKPDRLLRLDSLLSAVNSHPHLKTHGSAYGPDRHVANLQAFGVWRGRAPVAQPSARELFTTTFSHLTAYSPTALPSSDPNYSPAPQDVAPDGDLIGRSDAVQSPSADSSASPQTLDGVLVVSIAPNQDTTIQSPEPSGIIHHAAPNPGEQSVGWTADPVGWHKASSAVDGHHQQRH